MSGTGFGTLTLAAAVVLAARCGDGATRPAHAAGADLDRAGFTSRDRHVECLMPPRH